MKKILIPLLLSVVFISCSNEEDPSIAGVAQEVAGTYYGDFSIGDNTYFGLNVIVSATGENTVNITPGSGNTFSGSYSVPLRRFENSYFADNEEVLSFFLLDKAAIPTEMSYQTANAPTEAFAGFLKSEVPDYTQQIVGVYEGVVDIAGETSRESITIVRVDNTRIEVSSTSASMPTFQTDIMRSASGSLIFSSASDDANGEVLISITSGSNTIIIDRLLPAYSFTGARN
jgi:hypothetical protein